MRDTISVEICINCDGPQDIEDSVGAAHAGGASTVELCSAMHFDGLTPSVDQISAARLAFDNRPGLLVMIRPRQGNFLYSPKEIVAIHRQIEAAATAGADGVVFGALNEARCLALDVCRELIKTALASRPAGRPRRSLPPLHQSRQFRFAWSHPPLVPADESLRCCRYHRTKLSTLYSL